MLPFTYKAQQCYLPARRRFCPTYLGGSIQHPRKYGKSLDNAEKMFYIGVGDNMKNQNQSHLRYFKQKRIVHKYVRWMYELVADGRFYNLPIAKKTKKIPEEGTYTFDMIPDCRRVDYFRGKQDGQYYIRYLEDMYHCHDRMTALFNKNTQQLHISSVYRACESRYCPICQVKKAIAEYSKLMFNFDQFCDKYEYFLLTLTLPSNKDGFREELNLYKKCLRDLFHKFGFTNDGKSEDLCAGAYGSYEITYNEEHGWHPHLHIILAYPKKYIRNYQEHVYLRNNGDKVRYLDEIDIKGVKRNIKFSYDDVVKFWVDCVRSKTDKYNDYLAESAKKHYKGNEWLDVNFCRIDDIVGGVNELAKYLIDFTAINSADMLYVFMRDSYGTKQRLRRGIFIWSDEVNQAYKEYRNKIREDKLFILYNQGEVVKGTIHWNCNSYYVFLWPELKKVPVPYTNLYKDEIKWYRFKIPWDKKLE